MASSDKLIAFLKADVPGRVSAINISADSVTVGEGWSNLGDVDEALIRYVTGSDVARDQGRFRHFIEIKLRRRGLDKLRHEEGARELRTAAEELERAYEGGRGGLQVFQAGVDDVLISRVRAYRPRENEVSIRGFDINVSVFVEIDELEE